MLTGKEIYAARERAFQRVPMSHPVGEVATYADFLGREQTSVTGPKGHVLVTTDATRFMPGSTYSVHHSDSIRSILTTSDYRRAVKTACVAVGLDPSTLAEVR